MQASSAGINTRASNAGKHPGAIINQNTQIRRTSKEVRHEKARKEAEKKEKTRRQKSGSIKAATLEHGARIKENYLKSQTGISSSTSAPYVPRLRNPRPSPSPSEPELEPKGVICLLKTFIDRLLRFHAALGRKKIIRQSKIVYEDVEVDGKCFLLFRNNIIMTNLLESEHELEENQPEGPPIEDKVPSGSEYDPEKPYQPNEEDDLEDEELDDQELEVDEPDTSIQRKQKGKNVEKRGVEARQQIQALRYNLSDNVKQATSQGQKRKASHEYFINSTS